MEEKKEFNAKEILDIEKLSKLAGGMDRYDEMIKPIFLDGAKNLKAQGYSLEDIIREYLTNPENQELLQEWQDCLRENWDTL